MPRKKIHENQIKQVEAWKAENTDKIQFVARKDSPINKAVLQKAADALGLSLAAFLMKSAGMYILNELGPEWLEENENKAEK